MKGELVYNKKLRILQIAAALVVVAGAAGSVYFTLHAGRNNNSIVLPFLFVIWVLSPLITFLIVILVSKNWRDRVHHKWLYILMIIITIGSLVSYSGIFIPSGTKAAAVFLIIPLISWVMIFFVYLIIKFRKIK